MRHCNKYIITNNSFCYIHPNKKDEKIRKKDQEAYLHDIKGYFYRLLSSFKMCLEAIPKLQRKKKQNN